MSKYLERQFGVAPSKANMLIGAVMVPMAGCGTMLAGFLIHHFRMSCVRTLQFCVVLVVCSLMLSPMYFIYCDHDQLVGIERHYPVDDDISNHYDNETDYFVYHLEVSCNARCQCFSTEYHPVCAEFSDGSQVSFYSPCYAGCNQPFDPQQKEYSNCSCAPETTNGGYRRVKKGFCESKCRGLFAFLFLFAPFCFFTFAVGVALITVVLRTVDYDERSFALGIQWILVRIIGTIPAPVVFGWLFDVSCVRQHLDPCSGVHGSCMLYHNKSLADLFFAFSVGGQLVAIVCLLSVLLFFSNSLRDDPLPTKAAAAPNLSDIDELENQNADNAEIILNRDEDDEDEEENESHLEFHPMLGAAETSEDRERKI
ncbi:organic anion transporter polypeptide (OATP) family domain-containing protein [Ditylenchus destructor]|uniref:Solute carrier organic anion transporter family member n=1 Tax=Ditylenchus destructor TaxID=166010 RepID=A0AAD4NAB6_9BILA|nr:organic anion transporter polypeptide (OATP) family domain-containing protein [Ditylenchus destructor]